MQLKTSYRAAWRRRAAAFEQTISIHFMLICVLRTHWLYAKKKRKENNNRSYSVNMIFHVFCTEVGQTLLESRTCRNFPKRFKVLRTSRQSRFCVYVRVDDANVQTVASSPFTVMTPIHMHTAVRVFAFPGRSDKQTLIVPKSTSCRLQRRRS